MRQPTGSEEPSRMSDLFSSYLDLLLFQPAVMFTVNQYIPQIME
jgi:hypothetical protein